MSHPGNSIASRFFRGNGKTRVDRRVHWLSVAWCINTFGYSIAYPFLPLYLNNTRGFPMSQVGLMYLIMGVARMVAPSVSGPLVDRFGRRRVLIGMPALRAAVFGAIAVAVHYEASFWTLAALLFLAMFVGGFFQNASDAYVADVTRPEDRPEAYSRLKVGLNVGWMAGPAVGAFLARTPFSLLFALTAGLCLVTPVLCYYTCPEAARRAGEKPTGNDSLFSVIRRDRAFMQLLLFMFPLLMVSSQLVSTLSIFGKDHLQMSGTQIGFIYTLNGLLVILLQMPVLRLFSPTKLNTRIALGAICYAAGFYSMAFCTASWHLFLGVGIFTIGEMLAFPSLGAAASRLGPAGMTGRYMGIFGLVRGLGYSIGPFLGSILYEHTGRQPLRFWGAISIFAVLAAARFCHLHLPASVHPLRRETSQPG